MRKKAIKKKYGSRKGIFTILRGKPCLKSYNDIRGNEVYLNCIKHLLYNKPYKHYDYQSILMRETRFKTEEVQKIKEEKQND